MAPPCFSYGRRRAVVVFMYTCHICIKREACIDIELLRFMYKPLSREEAQRSAYLYYTSKYTSLSSIYRCHEGSSATEHRRYFYNIFYYINFYHKRKCNGVCMSTDVYINRCHERRCNEAFTRGCLPDFFPPDCKRMRVSNMVPCLSLHGKT